MQIPANHSAAEASPAEVEQAVIDWLRGQLNDTKITGSDNFLDIGGYSLLFSKLNRFLSEFYGVVLDIKITFQEPLSVAIATMQSR